MKVKEDADLTSDTDIIVRTLKQPSCTRVEITSDGNISFEVEKELGVEIVGETKMKISIEDEEDPWDDLDEEVNDDVLDEITTSVDENYIENT